MTLMIFNYIILLKKFENFLKFKNLLRAEEKRFFYFDFRMPREREEKTYGK